MLHFVPASFLDQLKSGYLRDFLKQIEKKEPLSVNAVVQKQQWTGLNFVRMLTNVIIFLEYLNYNITLIWLQKNCDDFKKLWQAINKILHRTKSSTIPDDTSDSSLANKFGSYFIENRIKIGTIFSSNNFHIPPKFSSFNSISCDAVRKILNLSPTKSCSLDPWPTFLVKKCVDILINPLTRIINMLLSEGYFPDKFKTAIVTPLLKNPSLDKSVLKNYRPVSGLNFVSTLIERTVLKQLKDYFLSSNLRYLLICILVWSFH